MRPLLCSQLQHLQQIKYQPLAYVPNSQHSAMPSQALHDHQLPGECFLLPLAYFMPQKGSRMDLQNALVITLMSKYYLEKAEPCGVRLNIKKNNHDTMQQ